MDKQIIFNGERISRTKVRNNILKVYNQTDTFSDWYKEAHQFSKYLSDKYKTPLNSVIGIISALSPRLNWDKNKEIAEFFLATNKVIRDNGKQIHMTVPCNKAKLIRLNDDEQYVLDTLSGDKTKSFYLNIKYPDREVNVTVDRHAIAIALGRIATQKEHSLTNKSYKFFEDCYKWTAEQLGIRPLLLQSITWETWRNIK